MRSQDLMNSILQETVQGKLVEQFDHEEPASVLLEYIREERKKLIAEKKIKAPKSGESVIYRELDGSWFEQVGKSEPVCIDNEIPFDIPTSWEWARLDSIAFYKKGPFGSSLTKSMFIPDGPGAIKVYEQKNAIKKDCELGEYFISESKFQEMKGFEVFPGEIIVSCAGTIGETYVLPEHARKGIINQALMRIALISPEIMDFYLLYFDYVLKESARSQSKGSAIKNIPPFAILKQMLMPIPPLAEQQRIVAKVEELKPLVEKYGELETSREALEKELPGNIKKSILQAAIQGRLVPQDDADEPASALLARIHEERVQLIKEKKMKAPKGGESVIWRDANDSVWERRGKGEAVCIDEEIPFEIPESWEWCRAGSLVDMIAGTSFAKGDIRKEGVRIIRGGNVGYPDIALLDDDVFLESSFKDPAKSLKKGDVVIVASTGSNTAIGRSGYVSEDLPDVQIGAFLRIIRPRQVYLVQWIKQMFATEYYRRRIRELAHGTNINNVKEAYIAEMLIPIPPLAEQQRIVEKIEALMPMIERLRDVSQ